MSCSLVGASSSPSLDSEPVDIAAFALSLSAVGSMVSHLKMVSARSDRDFLKPTLLPTNVSAGGSSGDA
jgi:hypothetical protein